MDRYHASHPPGSFLRMLLIAFAFALLTEGLMFLAPQLTATSPFNMHILVGLGTVAALTMLFANAYQWQAMTIVPFIYAAFRAVLEIIVPPIIIRSQPTGDILGLPAVQEFMEINAFIAIGAGAIAAHGAVALVRAFFKEEKRPARLQEETWSSAL